MIQAYENERKTFIPKFTKFERKFPFHVHLAPY